MSEHLSRDEVDLAFERLSRGDNLRLAKWARIYAASAFMERDDLLEDTIEAVLRLGRKCPRAIPFMVFMKGAIRSTAWNSKHKRLREHPLLRVVGGEDVDGVPDAASSAEDMIITAQDSAAAKEAVLELFRNRPDALRFLEGAFQGLDVEELKVLLKIGEREFDSLWRLIRRRIERAFPNGWRS